MLNLDLKLVYTLINMLLLYVLFRIFLFKPLNRVLEQRRKTVQASLDQAKQSADQADALKSKHQEMLKNAQAEVDEIIRQAKEQGQIVQEKMIEEARIELEQKTGQMREQIRLEREKMLQQARDEIVMLALAAASKILEREIDPDKDNNVLVEQLIREVGVKE